MKIKIGLSTLILPAVLAFSLSSPLWAKAENDDPIDSEFDSPLVVSDEDDMDEDKDENKDEESDITAINEDDVQEPAVPHGDRYISYKGTVSQVENGEIDRILVTGETGDIYYNIHDQVKIYDLDTKASVDFEDLAEDQEVTVYYGANTPQALSEPAQINPEVIVIGANENGKSKIDYFDESGLSADGQLQLNLDEDTVVYDINGSELAVEQALNKTLLVFYTVETRSMPPQTAPEMVIVLDDEAMGQEVAEPEISEPEEPAEETESTSLESVLEGIDPQYLVDRDEEQYVAVAIVAEELGYNVMWNPETATVTLEKGEQTITFDIGETEHTLGSFQSAPFIQNDRTFVEKSFLEHLK